MRRPYGVAGEEDADKEDQEDEDVRDGEDAPVYQAQHRSFAAARSNIVGIGGAVREPGESQLGAQSREP